MAKYDKLDLSNQRFSILTAIKKGGIDNQQIRKWECLCDCGNIKEISARYLIEKRTTSCGCTLGKLRSQQNRIDISGKRFGRLVVLKYAFSRKKHSHWECLCDCGKICFIEKSSLQNNRTKSCGCLNIESHTGKNSPMWNHSLTNEERGIRKLSRISNEDYVWKTSIYRMFKNRCTICNSSKNLNAHHIKDWKNNAEYRYDLDNGICLCKKCHIMFHKMFGYGNNNLEQLTYFMFLLKM